MHSHRAPFVLFSSALLLTIISLSENVYSQDSGPVPDRFLSISQNSTTTIEAANQSIWTGPGLNAYFELSGEFYVPTNADSVFSGRGRVFSMEVENDRLLAGLGYTSTRGGDPVQAAQGYYFSDNAGQSWRFIDFPLDSALPEECDASSVGVPCDIEFTYGSETYIKTRVTVPEFSPPFEVDFSVDTILSVNWASGLLRSTDLGETWERLILPPSTVNELNPDSTYRWRSLTPQNESVNRYDPRYDNNLLGFGLLIDSNENVWVGTAGGINISENALTATPDQIGWKRVSFNPDSDSGLFADWIISIREQPGTDRIWMTNWRTDPQNRDQFGIVYTDDLGETFHRFLEGIRVNDIGFFNGVIFAAADNGIYTSDNDGITWNKTEQIRSPNTSIRRGARYFALSATDSNLWVGTGDGIASTNDGGDTWRIIRVDMPLTGGNIYQPDAPDVETYAYPNPFSPTQHSEVRIKFDTADSGSATIRIFDFAMNQVKSIDIPLPGSGSFEAVWNGTDQSGRFVANGTYIYVIDKPNGRTDGKILLLD